jgi:peptidoglycan/xylan/chitin deacetylase (PgdA/CDA1 family)
MSSAGADQRVFNFTFHGIGEPPRGVGGAERAVWISAPTFRRVLDRVAGEPNIRLMFDDGNRSDIEVALPQLLERRLTATFFIIADRIGRPGYLTTPDLRELVAHGMTIGSHGLRHRAWRGLPDDELSRELITARGLIQHATEGVVDVAACPFGAYDRRVVRRLRSAGYRHVFTSDGGGARATTWLQPRVSLRAWDGPGLVDETLGMDGVHAASIRVKSLVKAWR